MTTEKLPDTPITLFKQWIGEAEKSEPNDPTAMALATIGEDGRPAVRMVLMREYDDRGIMFFTNYGSKKGKALEANPVAEANFYWKSLKKQIRISGRVEKASAQKSDEYYNSRYRESRIGAWASKQSQIMENGYQDLKDLVEHYDQKFEGLENPPRPDYWGGFLIKWDRVEFWQEQPYRLHKRFVYTKNENGTWDKDWLYP